MKRFFLPFVAALLVGVSHAQAQVASASSSAEIRQTLVGMTYANPDDWKGKLTDYPGLNALLQAGYQDALLQDNRDAIKQYRALGFPFQWSAPEPGAAAVFIQEQTKALEFIGKKADAAYAKEEAAREAAYNAKLKAAHDAQLAEQAKEDQEAARINAAQDKLWTTMERDVLSHQYDKARALFYTLGQNKIEDEYSAGVNALSGDIDDQRGDMVFIEATFDSNAPGGVLAMADSSKRVFISGLKSGSLVSGETITAMCQITGTYTYTTVLGSSNTVPAVLVDLRL